MSQPHILVTGASGSVGLEMVRWLARNYADCRCTFLLRAGTPHQLLRKWHSVMADAQLPLMATITHANSFHPLAGDVTRENLGISHWQAKSLQRTITHIIHSAADVNFLSPIKASRLVNVGGTRHMLDFASACPRLVCFGHVSSLFVAGKRSGLVLEEDLEHSAGFVSTYERTKYEAELLVRQHMGRLPIAVYRLALLPGRGTDGYIHRLGAFHLGLQSIADGCVPVLPGSIDSEVSLLPTDYAVDVMLRLFLGDFRAGRTVHVADRPGRVRLRHVFTTLEKHCNSARSCQIPAMVKPAEYVKWLTDAAPGDARTARLYRVLETIVPHLVLQKTFERTSLDRAETRLLPAPSFDEYCPRILARCIRARSRPMAAFGD